VTTYKSVAHGWLVTYPSDWLNVSEEYGVQLAVREPERVDGMFGANANVVMQNGDGTDLASYGPQQADALLDELESPFLVDRLNVVVDGDDWTVDLVVAHEYEDRRLTLWQRHLRRGAVIAVLSLTVESIEFGSRFDELDAIAGSLRFGDE
jgi:hypothetical protein